MLHCNRDWSYYDFNSTTLWHSQRFVDMVMGDPYMLFIKKMLERGEKGDISCMEQLKSLPLIRKQHTVSCFLLGNMIYNESNHLKGDVDRVMENIRKCKQGETGTKRFRYMWMLISVFHDLGYKIENNNCQENKEVDKAFSSLPVYWKSVNDASLMFPTLALYKPYTKALVKRYYEYRKQKWNCIDHGIAGGALLFKDLCELRKRKAEYYHGDYSDNGLYWGEELEQDFLFAAWTVACHNIYQISSYDQNVDYYQKFNLRNLISDNKLIDKEQLPLLYLLCLVDSIEPVKLTNSIHLLDKIDIDISNNAILIDLTQLTDWKVRLGYLGKMRALNTWLTTVEIKDEECATIEV